jgi:hypothetical protein
MDSIKLFIVSDWWWFFFSKLFFGMPRPNSRRSFVCFAKWRKKVRRNWQRFGVRLLFVICCFEARGEVEEILNLLKRFGSRLMALVGCVESSHDERRSDYWLTPIARCLSKFALSMIRPRINYDCCRWVCWWQLFCASQVNPVTSQKKEKRRRFIEPKLPAEKHNELVSRRRLFLLLLAYALSLANWFDFLFFFH